MTAASLAFLAPLLIILNYSFKTKKELYVGNPLALPQSLNLTNYANAYKKLNLQVTFFNTALYTVVSVLILALLCGAAAWAIARNRESSSSLLICTLSSAFSSRRRRCSCQSTSWAIPRAL